MSISRRDFVQLGLVAGAAVAISGGLAGRARAATRTAQPTGKSDKPLRILILGGTAFLGPAIVDVAKSRGHTLTLFNRGKTEKRIGAIDGVEKRFGNRDPKLHSDETDDKSPLGLSELEKGEWDVVIDTSGYYPRAVKASAELLAPRVKQYVFISTTSVYKRNDQPGQVETGELDTMADEKSEEVGKYYGALKALCEQAAEKAMPGRVTNIRPGYIVGPGDGSDRFTYWPVRASRGGEMLAPGKPQDAVQFIDVRDLAAFIIRCCEKSTMGAYTLCGPAKAITWGETLDACVAAAKEKGVETKLTWVDWPFLEEKGAQIGRDLSIWIPPEGEYIGFHSRNNAKAVAAGLVTRPAIETCRDLIAWWPKEVERRDRVGKQLVADATQANKPAPKIGDPTKLRVGMTAEREAELLKAWKERAK